jgi:hypothetical protein
MDSQVWGTMMVIKEILAAMNSTGRSTGKIPYLKIYIFKLLCA